MSPKLVCVGELRWSTKLTSGRGFDSIRGSMLPVRDAPATEWLGD
jgi:hypothetical protein